MEKTQKKENYAKHLNEVTEILNATARKAKWPEYETISSCSTECIDTLYTKTKRLELPCEKGGKESNLRSLYRKNTKQISNGLSVLMTI